MAAGKPVVATQIPELAPYKDAVYIAKNAPEFSACIKKALYESDDKKRKKRILYSLHNTWAHRGISLSREITKIIFPKVSIVILSYNNPFVTTRCIDSIIEKSSYSNIEIIVVDNGSDLETISVLNTYAQKYSGMLKLIRNKSNKGFSAGNNRGLAESTGDYIIILNNDTLVFPGWISRLVYHASSKDVGLVGPITNTIGNEQKVELETRIDIQDFTVTHWGETHELRNLAAFCWIMRRSTYTKIGGFDEKYGRALFEDDDYCMMIKKEGLKLLCADDVFVYHEGSKTVGSDQASDYK
ncbi:MAG: glycosyltransferase, partial [Patescibacteria group bacterium]